MVSGGGAVGGEIFVNIRTEGGVAPGTGGGVPRPPGGGGQVVDKGTSLLNDKQKEQLEGMRSEKKALKEYQDFQKLKQKEGQNELINELQRGRRQATMVAGAVTTGMLARNSKIMSTTMGSLSDMFGAFIDVFLMPFIPLIIPVLKYIASLLPKWMEWTQKFADMFAKNPLEALKWAAEEFKHHVAEWGVKIGALFGLSEEEVRGFYKDVGEWSKASWLAIQTAWIASVDYIKGVWDEAGGDVWTAIKIVAGDAWRVAQDASKAAWGAFEKWQPGVASAIKTAWGGAAGYIQRVWEESGCSVWGSIQAVGMDAMGSIGRAGVAAWNAFKSWQPGVARSIEDAFCGAVNYITSAWAAGGGTIVGFFGKVARDVGGQIMNGLSWLWSDEGGGMKQNFINMWQWIRDNVVSAIGNFLEDKTGERFGLGHGGATSSRWAIDSVGGSGLDMGPGAIWRMNNFNPDKYKSGMMQGGQQFKDVFTNMPFTKGGLFGGASDAEKGIEMKVRVEERFKEEIFNQENLERIMRELTQSGFIQGGLPSHDQELAIEHAFVTDPRYEGYLQKVDIYRANGKWKAEVTFKDNANPPATIDGFP